jgi:hypothetical protein
LNQCWREQCAIITDDLLAKMDREERRFLRNIEDSVHKDWMPVVAAIAGSTDLGADGCLQIIPLPTAAAMLEL